ncbi:MAG: hypothetical protein GVX78_02085 [Bacteroidetes bacterium]|jgi:hypothetical protein|nr:hypothetical protein [Bacteroidota bacterium]
MQLGWFDWLAFTIPSIMLFGIAYFFIEGWLKSQRQAQNFKTFQALSEQTLPLKLQAYERLALFLERIKIDQIILRMRSHKLPAYDLSNLILITIQQEYEHNLSQQVYVSEQLWQIIHTAKEQNVRFVMDVQSRLPKDASGEDFLDMLDTAAEERQMEPLQTALKAIRLEAQKFISA